MVRVYNILYKVSITYKKIHRKGACYIVVRSSRIGTGAVVPAEQSYIDEHFIDGDSLNPQKARVLLQLALTKTHDPQAIQAMFHKY